MRLRAGDGVYLIPPCIQGAGNPLDISALSRCVPALVGDHHRHLFPVKAVVELSQVLLQPLELFLILLLLYGLIQRNLRKPGHLFQRKNILKKGHCKTLILQRDLNALGQGLQNLKLRPFF